MFSRSSEYTLKACIFIAKESLKDRKASVATIARSIGLPEAFVAKLLQPLSKAGLLSSSRGKYGGFSISPEKMQTSLMDIIQLTEHEDFFSRCALGLYQCNNEEPCPLHHSFKYIRRDLHQMMTQNTLYDMARKINDGIAFLRNK